MNGILMLRQTVTKPNPRESFRAIFLASELP